jgi:hypothetical protein
MAIDQQQQRTVVGHETLSLLFRVNK